MKMEIFFHLITCYTFTIRKAFVCSDVLSTDKKVKPGGRAR
jgi:hypothetical protein